jgi:hypothetical protein
MSEDEVSHHALTPSATLETVIRWSDNPPTMPGWYWLRHAMFHGRAGAWHESLPVMVEVVQDGGGGFHLHVPGTDRVWSFDELVVAEWAGLLCPPA